VNRVKQRTSPLAWLALPGLLSCLSLAGCAATGGDAGPRSRVALAPGLTFADATTIAAPVNWLAGYTTRPAAGLIHAVVEIPAGTTEKWEVGLDGIMRWDREADDVRNVAYLGYPGNYGIIPRAVLGEETGGDGDPLDVIVLGPQQPRGAVVVARAIGTIELVDSGEQDDKILAVPLEGALAGVESVRQLDAGFPGITTILRTWFENYKGPGRLICQGFGTPETADRLIGSCAESFARTMPGRAR